MASATFTTAADVRSIGFTDENGKQVERRVEGGKVTAHNGFEERVFEGMNLQRVADEPKAKGAKARRASKRSSKPEAVKRPGETSAAAKATEPSGTPISTSTDDAIAATDAAEKGK